MEVWKSPRRIARVDDGVGNNPVASTLGAEHPRMATYTVTQNAAPACVLRGGLRELIPRIISASRVGLWEWNPDWMH
jgi:hypothetical protein